MLAGAEKGACASLRQSERDSRRPRPHGQTDAPLPPPPPGGVPLPLRVTLPPPDRGPAFGPRAQGAFAAQVTPLAVNSLLPL
jgi:hypothetical protein